ncbi:hypothetical protein MMC25_003302 [Agyrium rufum]|nr:hypothetical protein [Agyrium rufum]
MGFFRSLKGDHPDHVGSGTSTTDSTLPHASGSRNSSGYRQTGLPSYEESNATSYPPPPGPPPDQKKTQVGKAYEYAPPPGPPPSHNDDPPAYHDWASVPEPELLPPPPAINHETSPTNNAAYSDAIRAHQWCHRNPLVAPHLPATSHLESVRVGDIQLIRPREYDGDLQRKATGYWRGSSTPRTRDCCLLSNLPLYFAMADSPFRTERAKRIYFEVTLHSLNHRRGAEEPILSLGFCALPYPSWRMPGWERGSIGIHSDDGRRYISDTEGGIDFTEPFRARETFGVGVSFEVPENPSDFRPSPVGGEPLKGNVIFTRNGRKAGGWNIHEEMDISTEFGTLGIDGKCDLYAAIGVCAGVEFETHFASQDWLYRGFV